MSNKIKSCSHDAQIAIAIVLLSSFVLSGREFFFLGFIVILEFFLIFFYLSNAEVKNCGSFKCFGFIYI